MVLRVVVMGPTDDDGDGDDEVVCVRSSTRWLAAIIRRLLGLRTFLAGKENTTDGLVGLKTLITAPTVSDSILRGPKCRPDSSTRPSRGMAI